MPRAQSWARRRNRRFSVSLYRRTTASGTQGEKVGSSQTLSAANSWSYVFTGLDARYYYYIREDATVSGFVTTYSNSDAIASGTITVTNRKIATTYLDVAKQWKNMDGSARSTNLPASISVELYRATVISGVTGVPSLVGTHALTATENWLYRWADLPVTDESGNTFAYYLREVVITGFDVSYSSAQTAQTADSKTVYLATTGATYTVTNRSNGNAQYIEVPLTGATGTAPYGAFGSILILLAATQMTIWILRRKRKPARGEKP